MKNRMFSFLVTIVILMSLVSCNNVMDKAPMENGAEIMTEKANLVLNVNKNNFRTVLAPDYDLEDMTYTLKGIKNGADETTIKSDMSYSVLTGGADILVDIGSWDFTLLAIKDGKPRYSAVLENVKVVTGENSLSFELVDVPQTGSGGFRILLSFPNDESVSEVKAGLFDAESNVVRDYETLSINGSFVTYEKSNVASGIYIASFKFFKSDDTEIKPGYSELVQIKDDRISTAERTVENFERLHSITYNLNGGEFLDDVSPLSFYEYQRIVLPTTDSISKNGYTFNGWYENEDFSGDAITEIPSFTSKNMEFYAKWIAKQYRITYEGLNGEENPNPEIYTSDDEIKLKSAVPKQDGMAFAGWMLDGKIVSIIPEGSYGDIVLTAKWKRGKGFSVDELDSLSSWLSSQNGEGPFAVIVTGNKPNFSIIKTALNNNTTKKVNLDLSGTDEITEIGEYAFSGCTSLASVEIPDSVTSIGVRAFSGCTSLASVEIGDSVTSIGYYAFSRCTSLANVKIPNSVTSISVRVFEGCTSLSSVEIGNSVTSIGERTFYECTSLASVEIGDSVTSIGDDAFYGCTSLVSVEIPDSVTSIGVRAFFGTSLVSFVIPDSVTEIGRSAFNGSSLENMFFKDTIGWYYYSYSDTYCVIDVEDSTSNANRLKPLHLLKPAKDTTYKVEHLQQNIENNEYTVFETETIDGASGYSTNAKAKTYEGFNSGSFTNTTISSDGSTVVQVKYDRKSITLTFNLNGGTGTETLSEKYGTAFELPDNPKKTGYSFAGWYDNEDFSGDAITEISSGILEDMAFWAKWAPNTLGISVTLPPLQTDVPEIKYSIDGNKVTLTAETGHTAYTWFVDMEQKQSGASNTLELDATEMGAGLYSVMVGIDGKYSSTIILAIEK